MGEGIMAKRTYNNNQEPVSIILPSSTLQWKNLSGTVTYTFPSGSPMQVRSNSSDTQIYCLTSAINLSNIKNIMVNVENISCGAGSGWDGKGYIELTATYRGTTVLSYNYILKDGQYVVDVSNLTGNHYLIIGCANVINYGCYCNFDVPSIKCFS